MIRWLATVALIVVPWLAHGAPVVVKSGEHDGFTRLVMEYGAPVDWQVGRTADGYELKLNGDTPQYDLSAVFDLIGKGRLAAIWVDPASQRLRIGIGCACHAIPFEFRPGIVVIDLRDGAPPKGSSFELALDGSNVGELVARAAPKPKPRPGRVSRETYDWKRIALAERLAGPDAAKAGHTDSTAGTGAMDPFLEPLRANLLRQVSRGAAQGVVDMTLPASSDTLPGLSSYPSVRIGVGELPGISAGLGLPDHRDIAGDGRDCVPADFLDLAGWEGEGPVFEQIGEAMAGLSGEFDKPEPEAVLRAVRFNLYLGFGAEARQLLRAFPVDMLRKQVFTSIAHLMDDEFDPDPAFANLESCDGPSALWALLSDPAPIAGTPVNARPILLAFSALPIHLRRHLGNRLAERFIKLGDTESARFVRDAILRAPGSAGNEVDLLQAAMDLGSGDPKAAEATAEEVLTEPGPNAGEALIVLTEAQVAQTLPVEPSVAMSLAAMLPEHQGTSDEHQYRRAVQLAAAASGDFDTAFATQEASHETWRDVWRLLARLGPDDALLNHALPEPGKIASDVDKDTRQLLAQRLLDLGFPDQALRWLTPTDAFDAVLVAKANLAASAPAAALAALSGKTEPEALALQAKAYLMLGEDTQAAEAFHAAGDVEAGWRATGLAQDWSSIAADGPELWKAVAASTVAFSDVAPPATGAASSATTPDQAAAGDGPLARGRTLVDDSASMRQALDKLLSSLPDPAQKKP